MNPVARKILRRLKRCLIARLSPLLNGHLFETPDDIGVSIRSLLLSKRYRVMLPVGNQNVRPMTRQADTQQGTPALMVPKTIEVLGPQLCFGLARRADQTSGTKTANGIMRLLTFNWEKPV